MFTAITAFFTSALYHLIIPGISIGTLLLIVAAFIPPLYVMYRLPTQIVGLILVLFFVFQSGKFSEVTKENTRSLIDKATIATLQAKSAQINTQVVIQYVDRIKIVEKIKDVPTTIYVTKEADSKCVIDHDTSGNITRMLNAAGEGSIPDAPVNLDGKAK